MRPLFTSMRVHALALVAGAEDPAAELLAMVWGPRFDREHARGLINALALDPVDMGGALVLAADSFDRLTPTRQQRLRQLIRRHAGGTISA